MNPYHTLVKQSEAVMKSLIANMTICPWSIFKNVAAVYIVWQDEYHKLQMEAQNWEMRR